MTRESEAGVKSCCLRGWVATGWPLFAALYKDPVLPPQKQKTKALPTNSCVCLCGLPDTL